jgi:hypothetical protein
MHIRKDNTEVFGDDPLAKVASPGILQSKVLFPPIC